MSKSEKVEDDKMYLSESELRSLENVHNEQRVSEKDVKISSLNVKIAELELKLFSANYTLKSKELEELKKDREQKNYKFQKNKEKGAKIVSEIGESKGLKKQWGFDPITGEINE